MALRFCHLTRTRACLAANVLVRRSAAAATAVESDVIFVCQFRFLHHITLDVGVASAIQTDPAFQIPRPSYFKVPCTFFPSFFYLKIIIKVLFFKKVLDTAVLVY